VRKHSRKNLKKQILCFILKKNKGIEFMEPKFFTSANKAIDYAKELYEENIKHISKRFKEFASGKEISEQVHGYYPYIRMDIKSAGIRNKHKGHLSYGLVSSSGRYETTLTAFEVFEGYYKDQIALLLKNHKIPVEVGLSEEKIPLQFALKSDNDIGKVPFELQADIKDIFDSPDLTIMEDDIANGENIGKKLEKYPLSLFTASRVDVSLKRLNHYTGTKPKDFQRFVLFTNYQAYIDEFIEYGRKMVKESDEYIDFVEPSKKMNVQMPAYHLKTKGHKGITLINIGVGPSNAKTITDHIAVLRPHAWIMLGHCAGLRNSQKLGDYVLAHGYLRMDGLLDEIIPLSVPIPALSEIQNAIQEGIMAITGDNKETLKNIMRTGTVITTGDRDWELDSEILSMNIISVSRAIALDMESATIATNGYRFRIPYGTLLSISDKPLHGELKLPGMANDFYEKQISQHMQIGIKTMEILRKRGPDKLHSRKLRSFKEVGFR